jgi:subtilase family serine protease
VKKSVMKMHGRAWWGMLIIVAGLIAGCTTVTVGKTTSSAPGVMPTAPISTFTPSQPGTYTPADLRAAYHVDSLIAQGFTGKGQTIIDMVCYGSPTVQADLDAYSQRYGLPKATVTTVDTITTKPTSTDPEFVHGWGVETELDVELYHALAPDAGIVVLATPICAPEGITGLPEQRQELQYAIDHHLGNIIAVSGGTSEVSLSDPASRAELAQWDTLLKQATTQDGLTFFVSSGDNGSTDYIDASLNLSLTQTTSFPTDSPWVTSVGGTSLLPAAHGFTESAWNGSGGGFSKFFAEPDYQKTLPAAAQTLLNNRRGVPDVAAVADSATGVLVYVPGGWATLGGTSISAPIWAGIMAIANQKAGHPLGFINPALYKLGLSSKAASDFNDITSGNNTQTVKGTVVPGYPAIVGWDPITGFGTPKSDTLIPDLIAAVGSK